MLNGSTGGFCVLVLSLGALICSGLPAQAPPPVPPGGSGVREAPRENGTVAGKDEFPPPPPGPGSESGPEGGPPGPDGGFEKPPHFFQKPAIVFHVVTKVYEAEAPLSGAASSETSSGAAPASATPSSAAPAGATPSSVAASSTAPSNGAPSTQAPSGGAEPAENKAGEGLASAAKTAPEGENGENSEVWQKTIDKVVMPGQPVNIKLAGKNIAVVVQFTPYLKKRLLVAQQQSWFQEDDGNLRYETTIQTIPLKFNKDIYYFPLGEEKKGTEYFMEIVLNLTPYSDNIKHDE